MSEPERNVDELIGPMKRSLLYYLALINVILFPILLVVAYNIPPKPSISLLSLTTATDTVATYATTPTGGTFTAQNLTIVFSVSIRNNSISSRNNTAVIYSDLRVTGSQHGKPNRHDRPFISSAAATPSVASLVQFEPSNVTVEFRQPNATVVIEPWTGVHTGVSVLNVKLHLIATYKGKTVSRPMWANCNGDYSDDLIAQIVINGQDSPPKLYFTGRRLDCSVSSTWDTVVVMSYIWAAVSVVIGLVMLRNYGDNYN